MNLCFTVSGEITCMCLKSRIKTRNETLGTPHVTEWRGMSIWQMRPMMLSQCGMTRTNGKELLRVQ